MKMFSFIGVPMLVLAAFSGCANVDPNSEEDVGMHTAAAVKAKEQAPKLNLSHIECTPDGKVLVHFVLLFAGEGEPGELSGTYSGGTFGPVASDKHSGNVWHYNVILPAGYIDILTATTKTSTGADVTLKNAGEYAGPFDVCGAPPVAECPVKVEPAELFCGDPGNTAEECGSFGLVPRAYYDKDGGLSGLSFVSTQDAYVALVKSGSKGCPNHPDSAYRVYVNVTVGQVLETPMGQDISHVTYCSCPSK
jgi:hypothetical protein